MKKHFIGVALLAMAVVSGQGAWAKEEAKDFAAMKKEASEKLAELDAAMQKQKTCIAEAMDQKALEKCHEIMKNAWKKHSHCHCKYMEKEKEKE